MASAEGGASGDTSVSGGSRGFVPQQ
eukprot:COSAG01_NODE_17842_length_1120_cov_0.832517_2_plen_25_part_01